MTILTILISMSILISMTILTILISMSILSWPAPLADLYKLLLPGVIALLHPHSPWQFKSSLLAIGSGLGVAVFKFWLVLILLAPRDPVLARHLVPKTSWPVSSLHCQKPAPSGHCFLTCALDMQYIAFQKVICWLLIVVSPLPEAGTIWTLLSHLHTLIVQRQP